MQIKKLGKGEVDNMGWSCHYCVRLSDTDTIEDRYFSCYHEAVTGVMCATYWVDTALVYYRYAQIIIFNIICYVLLPGPSSHRIFLIWSSMYVWFCCAHNMAHLLLCPFKTWVPRFITTWPVVVSAREGSTCSPFFARATAYPVLS